ncbi:DNA-binding transcriptional regulator GbsR (MarR family) [Melghirimyces profundicolus]|uniref:HTH-type transcriptional regulator n=1 Tax=Melghirimyces profundicolus TaxID=1242148 RepID=A0A2T6C7J0_9BACL|nr:DNA-binding transcriptional regulator GbsR (MarR family) [Melghirimyces profundicolus]
MKGSHEDRLDVIKSRIIEQIGNNMKIYGVSQTTGRVMATIYYHQKPMTLDELSEEMGMTKMSMSNAVRELMDLGVAEKIHVKGSRKDHYVIEQDYYQFFIDLFCTSWSKTTHAKAATRMKLSRDLEEIIQDENADPETKEEAKKILEENHKAIEFFNWINRLIQHFESHEIFKHVPIKEGNKKRDPY